MTDRARNVWGMIGRSLFVLSIFIAFGCAFLMGRYITARELSGAAHAKELLEPSLTLSNGWTPQQVQTFGESVLGVAYACQAKGMPEPECQKFLAYVLASKFEPDHRDD